MVKKVSLQLSDKAFKKLNQFSERLGISPDEFASLCFEYVDVKHQGIKAAAKKMKQANFRSSINKDNLNQHLKDLSSEQIELLLAKAALKKKS